MIRSRNDRASFLCSNSDHIASWVGQIALRPKSRHSKQIFRLHSSLYSFPCLSKGPFGPIDLATFIERQKIDSTTQVILNRRRNFGVIISPITVSFGITVPGHKFAVVVSESENNVMLGRNAAIIDDCGVVRKFLASSKGVSSHFVSHLCLPIETAKSLATARCERLCLNRPCQIVA
jgi:hypothetical protein